MRRERRQLWAPWRMAYVQSGKPSNCIFCIDRKKGYLKKHLILFESGYTYVIMNKYPYAAGHVMVVPIAHKADIQALDRDELTDFFYMVRNSVVSVQEALAPDGMNIGANLGSAAGAGAAHHFHFHIVPRWTGDHNFMPVISDTMVFSDYLENTYQRLLPYFKRWADEDKPY